VAARKKKRVQEALRSAARVDPLLTQMGAYACSHCARPLQVEMVVTADVERRSGVATGYITFEHFCSCEPGAIRVSRRLGSHQSFVTLFGTTPALPYRAPFHWQGVVDDDPAIARWRRELEQVSNYDDFIRFLGAV
jgi:hypothetical protein